MPKAKHKRKGAPPPDNLDDPKRTKPDQDPDPRESEICCYSRTNLLDVPEEIVCLILNHLDIHSISCLERTCKHLRTVIIHARIWRRILMNKLEFEPEIGVFLSEVWDVEQRNCDNNESSSQNCKVS